MDDVLAALTGGVPWTGLNDIVKAAKDQLDKLPLSREAETLADRMEEAAYREEEHGEMDAWEGVATALGKLLLPALLDRTIRAGEPLPAALKDNLPPARVHQIESAINGLRGESPWRLTEA